MSGSEAKGVPVVAGKPEVAKVPEKSVSPEEALGKVLSVFKGGSKVSGAEILKMVLDNGSLEMISDVKVPLANAVMNVVADFYESIGYGDLAGVTRGMVIHQLRCCPAKGGKRVKEVLDALKSVLTQEFEISKSTAKRGFGQ